MEEQIFGIDLGTTNSAIAVIDSNGQPEVLPNAEERRTTPSVIQFCADGSILVGELAKRQLLIDKENVAHFFKRDMGTPATYQYRGRTWTPTELSAEVLKKLKSDVSARLGREVRTAVITVPAYFQDGPRIATRRAGEMAGLDVVQIINEPTAAALAYGFRQTGREERILVYDWGGGTFDITLVQITPDGLQVIGTDGNHNLGGKDLDDRIVQYVCDEFRRRHGIDPLDEPYAFQEILIRSELAKQSLSTAKTAVVSVNCQGKAERIEITRDAFERMTCDLVSQTEMLMNKVLEETGYDYSKIASVLMVGGSTRLPACKELVRRLTGREPNTSVNPDECVAVGAAIQASLYRRQPARAGSWRLPARIEDVMSHSMGMIAISADGDRYINSVLIPRNKTIPCREVRPYQVRPNHGPSASVSVYVTQGEGEDHANCSFVGKYVIKDIPTPAKGQAVIDIAYEYDRSGVVSVSSVARDTNRPLPVEKVADLGDMSWLYGSPRDVERVQHKTILAAVDLSGSMSGKPLRDAQEALHGFFAKSDLANTSIGLMSFADKVNVDQGLTQDARLLQRAVDAWSIGLVVGGGNATDPFEEALLLLRDCVGPRYFVVLTDGVWDHCEAAEQRAKKCHEAGIEVIAIGFGGADRAFLKRIATSEESALFVSSVDLVSTFGEIAQVLVEDEVGQIGSAISLHRKK
jgi:molecular chaperone DnaK